eukprot:CAMPEP_0197176676 /NCGR_PEP_ID=MMETSP1423-20130617/2519_1 /TAXON_ID=476441 /ORGANISM="Pseudo-nitzschia heimii, Strain UNC1101" /LENGTH=501 /DNA_ID=CAMNT_0042626077 /DNA_START=326 /DNA_END=1831 /DNA_ORIENTATION=-
MTPSPLHPSKDIDDESSRSSRSDRSSSPLLISPPSTKNSVPSRAREVDDLLTKELLQLSFADRSAISEEIHGVRCMAPKETPDFLKRSLIDLQQQLDAMPYKPAYDKAQAFARNPEYSNKSYINTTGFRLKFLRCELFDVEKAAIRLIRYLDLMFEMYGLIGLKRKILLSDFSKNELQVLRAGFFQIFPFRDRSGRRIMCIVGQMGVQFDPFIRMKAYFYFWMAVSEDVESQQKGVVFLVWPGSNPSFKSIPNQKDRTLHMKCNTAAPIRIAAVHFCFPNETFYHLLRSIYAMTLSLSYRLRLKFHVGENVELQYSLKSYGIPTHLTPMTDSGNIKTTHLKQWMRLRKILEVGMTPDGISTNTMSIVECPRSNDVIFRPGTSMLCHPGNVVFRGMIESKQDRITVKRAEKEEVALEIIREVNRSGGRFLMWDNGGWWSELEDVSLISTKITISYRDFKMKAQAKDQQRQRPGRKKAQNADSSTFAFLNQDNKKRKRFDRCA